MSQIFNRRLVTLFALVLVANAILAPVAMAHMGFEGHPGVQSMLVQTASSQDDGVPPCHGHSEQSQDRTDQRTGSLPCCAGAGCLCLSVSAALVFFGDGIVQARVHDSVPGMACASPPQALPDSLLRPPIC